MKRCQLSKRPVVGLIALIVIVVALLSESNIARRDMNIILPTLFWFAARSLLPRQPYEGWRPIPSYTKAGAFTGGEEIR